MLRALMTFALLSTSTPAPPVPAKAAQASACTAPEYHQLDFWIGDWDTFEPDGSGSSEARAHIDPILNNCAIHELYEQIDGLVGDSFLSYDGVRKLWQQTWVTNRGSLMVIQGAFKDGALILEGEMHGKEGNAILQRVTWKAEPKGVREAAVMSKDGGKTWVPAFDVLFMKHH